MITLHFPYKLISKDNEKVFNGRGRPVKSGKFRAYEEKIAWDAKAQYQGEVLECPIAMVIEAYFTNKRHCDATNLFKSVNDSLQKIVYKNDRQILDARIVVMDERAKTDSFVVRIIDIPPQK